MLYVYTEKFLLQIAYANTGDNFDYSKVNVSGDIPLDRIKDMHGHNYEVSLSAYSRRLEKGVVVRSEVIEKIKNEWNFKNLNFHPALLKTWASTEATAEAILDSFLKQCGRHVFKASISLYETPAILIQITKRLDEVF